MSYIAAIAPVYSYWGIPTPIASALDLHVDLGSLFIEVDVRGPLCGFCRLRGSELYYIHRKPEPRNVAFPEVL